MKKKFLFGLAGIVVMAAAIVTLSAVNTNSPESDLLTKNIEALTNGELGGSGSCCYNDVVYGAQCGVDAATAQYFVSVGLATNWCCDSCGSASWM
jgi:hypothetical protein